MEAVQAVIIFIVGAIAGSIGALAGSQSLLTLPVLLLLGLPANIAIATNTFGVTGMPLASWYKFHKKNLIDYRIALLLAIPAILGAIIGANIVITLDKILLKKIIGVLTIVIASLFLLNPNKGITTNSKTVKPVQLALVILASFGIGIYGGFYTAGIGTFFQYLLIMVFGLTFLESAATNKPAIALVGIVAAAIFIVNKLVLLDIGLVLFTGTFVGSWVSTHYGEQIGNEWIKRLFIAVAVISGATVLLT